MHPELQAITSPHPSEPKLPSDDELLRWSRENVRIPWLRICQCWDRMSKGETVERRDADLPIPLTPFRADMRALFYIMRDLNPLMIFEPANLFTIILDSSGSRILRAYMERTRMNAYISLDDVDPSGKWASRALEIIASGNLSPLKDYLNEFMLKERGINVNWVKIANIQFFGALKDALEEFQKDGSPKAFIDSAYKAVKKIYNNKWIAFSPKPKAFARLEELVGGDKGIIRYEPSDLGKGLPDPELQSLLNDLYLVVLRGRDFTIALKFSMKKPFSLLLDQDVAGAYHKVPFHRLAREVSRGTGARMVLALQADALFSVLHECFLRPFPLKKNDAELVLGKLLYLVRGYRSQWAIHPVPIGLRWSNISRLSYWFLPKFIVEGAMVTLGLLHKFAFIFLEQSTVISAFVIEMYDGGVRMLKTFPANELSQFFHDGSLRENLIKAKHHIWHKDGWVNFAIAMQASLVKEVLKLNLSGTLTSIWRLPGAIPRLMRMWKIIRNDGIAVYPDRGLVELERWVKKTGRINVWLTALQIPFDRSRPKRRGVLYVRETIAALLALGVIVLFIIWGVG